MLLKKLLPLSILLLSTLAITPYAHADFESAKAAHKAGNYTEAFKEFNTLAERGDAKAQYNLGNMYFDGHGVKADYEKAFQWYSKAAEQGDADAQYNLGWMYDFGKGVNANYEKAFQWYSKAAEQGDAFAQNNIAGLYKNGLGVKQDVVEAVKWYQKSADQGNAVAQRNLANHYYSGEGIPKELWQAFYWFQKAAEQGDAESQNRAGVMLSDGVGTAQNHEKAFNYFVKASQQEEKNAMRNLGFAYQNGLFVDKNLILAHAWYNIAAKYGHPDAGKERDALSALINKKQLSQAQQIAGEWKPGNKIPNVAFKQDKTLATKPSQPEVVKVAATPKREAVTCHNDCVNGNCVRTFSDGRKERWQAPQKFNPFTKMFEFDTMTNACGV